MRGLVLFERTGFGARLQKRKELVVELPEVAVQDLQLLRLANHHFVEGFDHALEMRVPAFEIRETR